MVQYKYIVMVVVGNILDNMMLAKRALFVAMKQRTGGVIGQSASVPLHLASVLVFARKPHRTTWLVRSSR